jgi:hypothetical protein
MKEKLEFRLFLALGYRKSMEMDLEYCRRTNSPRYPARLAEWQEYCRIAVDTRQQLKELSCQ